MSDLIIKEVELDFLDKIKAISEKTFVETFGPDNTAEDIENYLMENINTKQVRQELANPASLFYAVELEGNVAAYMKLNLEDAQTEQGYSNSLEIQRLYVLKKYKKQGIGRKLMDKAIEEAENRQMDFVWLGVWEKNTEAIHFYEKSGFVAFDKHVFKLGDDEQTDYLMKYDVDHLA
ncbi:Ribosomal protein S18 acetylase RimI [Alkalibacterium subtropicum]|uniref:Ribosomal protein S18 acetylase RimI n=1 Tax=Alkalibacterium subtropicum TaxID=753702 RepID=A0A1I1HI28_9LACT|nr:GNAT family N-acetyltransferase [Alkalibacterium subtropicum]SFC23395.1 Ribosomal protein S18 acetylase RimI [Alkalibacterium subtropicum]